MFRSEPVETRGDQGAERRRHLELAVLGRQRQHLGDEEWVAAGGPDDLLPEPRRQTGPDQQIRLVGRKRLEPQWRRPRRAALE